MKAEVSNGELTNANVLIQTRNGRDGGKVVPTRLSDKVVE